MVSLTKQEKDEYLTFIFKKIPYSTVNEPVVWVDLHQKANWARLAWSFLQEFEAASVNARMGLILRPINLSEKVNKYKVAEKYL